jgi:RNA polymerase sigma factor for flagellar operon FliA
VQGIDSYEENADAQLLEEFVQNHRALVKKIALHVKRRLPSHIELEDLLQSGFIGLLEARQHYKKDMGTTFETFASIRIHGAIIDSLRKNSWATRESLKNMRLISDAISRIEQRNQKQASSEEVAAELGISLEEHDTICSQISICNVLSLDVIDKDNALFGDEAEDPALITQQDEMIGHIKELLSTFPEREQLVLSLYYLEEFTFKQIGEILGLTEARICQLHGQAISKLQTRIRRKSGKLKNSVEA